MIRKVRKWVSKKPSSFEERMNAQPDTFDIIQTQYTTEHQNHPIEVLDHLPGDSDVIVRRNERFESIEIVPKEPGDLSFEEQEILDFLDSAIDDEDDAEDDAFVDEGTEEKKEDNHEEIICKEDRNTSGSKSSSQSDNWSLEARERSSGRLNLMQKNIYLPDANDSDVIPNDVTPDLPDADYPGSESDSSEITIEDSPIIDKPHDVVTSQTINENELLPNNEISEAETKENAPAKILRGTSFNLPQGRSQTQTIEQEKDVIKEKPAIIEPVSNGHCQDISGQNTEKENCENLEPETQKPEPKSTDTSVKKESANMKEAVTINFQQNNKTPFKVTGFSRYGDGNNNNYPIMTSFKSQDGDLKLLTRNKPVNNLVKKFETMASSTS